MPDENQIFHSVVAAIEGLSADWEYDSELTPETRLIADLQMKSLDLVVLCTTMVRTYGVMPLDDLYTQLGEMPPETRELTLGGLVEFVAKHTGSNSPVSAQANASR
jgi:acyl carrier protein